MAYSRDPRERWKWAINQIRKQVRDDILMRDQYGFGLENYGDEDGFSVNVRPPTAETYASFVTNRRYSPVPTSAGSKKNETADSHSPIRKKSIFSANIFQRRKTVLTPTKNEEGNLHTASKVSTYEKISKLKRIYYWVFGIICFSYIVSSIVLRNDKTTFQPIPVLSPVKVKEDTITMLSVELRTQEGSHRAWGDAYITTFDNRMGFIDDTTWSKNEVCFFRESLTLGMTRIMIRIFVLKTKDTLVRLDSRFDFQI